MSRKAQFMKSLISIHAARQFIDFIFDEIIISFSAFFVNTFHCRTYFVKSLDGGGWGGV